MSEIIINDETKPKLKLTLLITELEVRQHWAKLEDEIKEYLENKGQYLPQKTLTELVGIVLDIEHNYYEKLGIDVQIDI